MQLRDVVIGRRYKIVNISVYGGKTAVAREIEDEYVKVEFNNYSRKSFKVENLEEIHGRND